MNYIGVRNIRHVQVKKVAYCPNLFKAIITYEAHSPEYDESDDIEYIKFLANQHITCPPCDEMEKRRRSIDKHER